MYIFSENLPDRSIQYYTATPVHSPGRTAHSSHLQPPAMPPLIQQPATPTLMVPSSARRKMDAGNVMESGYYSNPTTSTPVSPRYHRLLTPSSGGQDSVQNQVPGAIRGTRITKLGSPVFDSQHENPTGVGIESPLVSNSTGLHHQLKRDSEPVAGISKQSDHRNLGGRSLSMGAGYGPERDDSDIMAGMPKGGVGRNENWTGLDQADADAAPVMPSIADPTSDKLKLRERVLSLTADNVSLGQQLAREQKQRKMNEVRD